VVFAVVAVVVAVVVVVAFCGGSYGERGRERESVCVWVRACA
jgi:hypothetical protein